MHQFHLLYFRKRRFKVHTKSLKKPKGYTEEEHTIQQQKKREKGYIA